MKEEQGQSKRRGRPPKNAVRPKNGSFTFRLRDDLREKLEASAAARGMSLSEEVERRVNLSFDIATSPHNEYIIRAAAEAINMAEQVSKQKWIDSADSARMCFVAAKTALSVMPSIHGDSGEPDNDFVIDAAARVLGIRTALVLAGFPIGAVVEFGQNDVDLAIDQIRRKVLNQVEKAAERDPDGVTVTVDIDPSAGLGTPAPYFAKDPAKLEAALAVLDEKREAKRGRKTKTPM